jgi:hypothetical protein
MEKFEKMRAFTVLIDILLAFAVKEAAASWRARASVVRLVDGANKILGG